MKHEKIIKRDDGSRVKISAELFAATHSTLEYRTFVLVCAPGKRTWKGTYSRDDFSYRKLSMPERRRVEEVSQLTAVSPAELREAKLELWHKLKPGS